MKSRSKSSKKAEEQKFGAKTFTGVNYSSLQTGCDLCLHRVNYNLTKKKLF